MHTRQPYRDPRRSAFMGADVSHAVARNIDRIAARIRRLRAAQERVIAAFRSEPPVGIKRNDWIARKLNEG